MALFDLPLDELHTYRSASAEPEDFDAFWSKTLAEAREHDLDARFEPVDTGLSTVRVYDVTFAGFGGHPVKAWLTLPAAAAEPLPLVVEFVGYGGGRGLPHEHLLWASTGRAHFVMDTRGQGSAWGGGGGTADPVGGTPAYPGFMTRGLDAPENYYYRRVFTDAVRAVEAARSHPLTDPSRTVALGASQGGGITIAVGGLVRDLAAVAPDVPFLCDFPRATTLTDRHPYREVGLYLKTHRGRSGTRCARCRTSTACTSRREGGPRPCSRPPWRTRPARRRPFSPRSTPGRTRTRRSRCTTSTITRAGDRTRRPRSCAG